MRCFVIASPKPHETRLILASTPNKQNRFFAIAQFLVCLFEGKPALGYCASTSSLTLCQIP